MRAAVYETFGGPVTVRNVPDPEPARDGVIVKVRASGLCRSDWHAWSGHDPDVRLPHVPGHEFAGIVCEAGADVSNWKTGDRVTMPPMGVCGDCASCARGNHHLCDDQFQPGFRRWGSHAEYVSVDRADFNLVHVPESLSFEVAAGLGCRFSTSFRAIGMRANVQPGDWVAVHGAGGIGLAAIMIADALGANAIAVDITDEKLALARSAGASATLNARSESDIAGAIRELTSGGAHVSVDALGSTLTCRNSINCLRKQGRHVQIGLMLEDDYHAAIPMGAVVRNELEIVGSYCMPPHLYPKLIRMIEQNRLQPERTIARRIPLDKVSQFLPRMSAFRDSGITIVDRFHEPDE